MSVPWFKFYPNDWLAGTSGQTALILQPTYRMVRKQLSKISAVEVGPSSVSRRSVTRATNAGFSMVRCAGAPLGAPFLEAVGPILCYLATRSWSFFGQFNLNSRRVAMSAYATPISFETLGGPELSVVYLLNDVIEERAEQASKLLRAAA